MNCDDFLIRMHECLDDRLPIDSDLQLQTHADRCPSCRRQWTAWSQISSVISPAFVDEPCLVDQNSAPQHHATSSFARVGLGLAIAAAVLLVFVGKQPPQVDSVNEPQSLNSSSVTVVAPTIEFDLPGDMPSDAVAWWHDVQHRDWMAQTMPAVRRVRDGVAPLGRSLLQAVSILTVGGGEKTS